MKRIKRPPTFANSGIAMTNEFTISCNFLRRFAILRILAILKDLMIVVAKPMSTLNITSTAIPVAADITIEKSNTFQPFEKYAAFKAMIFIKNSIV